MRIYLKKSGLELDIPCSPWSLSSFLDIRRPWGYTAPTKHMGPSTPSPTRIFRFGLFEADVKAGELRKSGIRVRLPDRSFRILAILLDRPSQVITRDELRNQLWQDDTLVDFDHGLNNAVMRLRETLCDSSGNPRFIETLPRRG